MTDLEEALYPDNNGNWRLPESARMDQDERGSFFRGLASGKRYVLRYVLVEPAPATFTLILPPDQDEKEFRGRFGI